VHFTATAAVGMVVAVGTAADSVVASWDTVTDMDTVAACNVACSTDVTVAVLFGGCECADTG
jgi:hypothetical protein